VSKEALLHRIAKALDEPDPPERQMSGGEASLGE